jgi:hypothetical protein
LLLESCRTAPEMANRFVVATHDGMERLPEWLLRAVQEERVEIASRFHFKRGVHPADRVGDAEALAYLITVSFRCPMPMEYADITAYLTERVMKKWGREIKNLPEEVRHEQLTAIEEQKLREVKAELCRVRGRLVFPTKR